MAKAVGISPSSVQRIWRAHHLAPHRVKTFKLSCTPPKKVIVDVIEEPVPGVTVVTEFEATRVQGSEEE